jgi:hypothetical protein
MQKQDKLTDKNPFRVPDDYFEEVNRKIISATSGYEPVVKKTITYNRFRPFLMIAASVAGFIMLTYTAVRLLSPGNVTPQATEVSADEFNESYIDDLDIFTLEENVASLGFSEENPELDKKEIIDYLLQENIEISDIYEQL